MQYPLISEYVESIRNAEDNFDKLTYLRPVMDDNGDPVMSSGNFAVVFKMTDGNKNYAIKCFTKEQEGRAEAYQQIADELENIDSSYIASINFFEKELFVDCKCDENEFPVLLMDWIEGESMEKYIADNYQDNYAMSMLCYRFCKMAAWLRSQPFAHGDLKPDNIMVRPDGKLTLVDYDGMFVPAMKGQKSPTIGTKNFSHPLRTVDDFDETIDDFALASIALSLKAISLKPTLYDEYCEADKLLFSESDYRDICQCEILKCLYPSNDSEINILISLFTIAIERRNLDSTSIHLFDLNKPELPEWTDEAMDEFARDMEMRYLPYEKEWTLSFREFIKKYSIIRCYKGYSYSSVTDGGEEAFRFITKEGKEVIVFNPPGLTMVNFITQKDRLSISLMKSGHFIMSGCSTTVAESSQTIKMGEESI